MFELLDAENRFARLRAAVVPLLEDWRANRDRFADALLPLERLRIGDAGAETVEAWLAAGREIRESGLTRFVTRRRDARAVLPVGQMPADERRKHLIGLAVWELLGAGIDGDGDRLARLLNESAGLFAADPQEYVLALSDEWGAVGQLKGAWPGAAAPGYASRLRALIECEGLTLAQVRDRLPLHDARDEKFASSEWLRVLEAEDARPPAAASSAGRRTEPTPEPPAKPDGEDAAAVAGEPDSEALGEPPTKPSRTGKPAKDRQAEIIETLIHAKRPLTRSELFHELKWRTEGKLGANLAWMVEEGYLVNIPQRGYWPANRPVPE